MPAIALFTLALLVAAPPGPAAAPVASLPGQLTPEKPTVFVFFMPTSGLDQAFLAQLRKSAGVKAGIREVLLKTGDEPVARQFEIVSTPAALVYDRRGRLVGRSSSADGVAALVRKAGQVMRIDWAEPGDPRLTEMEKILGRSANSGIMRTMSLQPEWLRSIHELHGKQHRPDTALDRRTKEMIATYVSALNKCKF